MANAVALGVVCSSSFVTVTIDNQIGSVKKTEELT